MLKISLRKQTFFLYVCLILSNNRVRKKKQKGVHFKFVLCECECVNGLSSVWMAFRACEWLFWVSVCLSVFLFFSVFRLCSKLLFTYYSCRCRGCFKRMEGISMSDRLLEKDGLVCHVVESYACFCLCVQLLKFSVWKEVSVLCRWWFELKVKKVSGKEKLWNYFLYSFSLIVVGVGRKKSLSLDRFT